MEIHLVSFFGQVNANQQFASESLLENRQKALNKTALNNGSITHTHSWNLERLQATSYYKDNSSLLSQPRGCGYWAWKPYIILETLRSIPQDCYVVYCDLGKPYDGSTQDFGNQITNSLYPMVEWADQNNGIFPGVYLSHHGSASKWIKSDCFEIMDCKDERYKTMPTIQAGYTAWKNTPKVIEFLEKWQKLNLDSRLISDDPNTLGIENAPDFVRNCHDQATLTLLCEKEGVKAFGDEKRQFWGFRNINFIAKTASFTLKQENSLLKFPSINHQFNLLPRFLNKWIELIYCDKRLDKLNVLLLNSGKVQSWKEYFPSAEIGNHSELSLSKHYDFISSHDSLVANYTAENVIDIFNSLNEGGLALIGPFLDGESDAYKYCRQLANNEKFIPIEGMDSEKKPTTDLKIHNSKNPVFVSSRNDTYVLLYKPHKILSFD